MPTSQKKSRYDAEAAQYYKDVHDFLKQVHNGRRVANADPHDPKYSQEADDARQATRMGLKDQIRFGPSTPVWKQAPPVAATPAPQPGFMDSVRGYAEQAPRYLSQGLNYLKSFVPPPQRDPNESYRGHDPKVGTDPRPDPIMGALADPRNSWMGLGPVAGMAKFSKMGEGMGAWDDFMRKLRQSGPPDTGGFHVPTAKLRGDDPFMAMDRNLDEPDIRSDYLFGRNIENKLAEQLSSPNILQAKAANERYSGLHPNEQQSVDLTRSGQAALANERGRGLIPEMGGAEPPANILDMKWKRSK
jgi:hypothetical protein